MTLSTFDTANRLSRRAFLAGAATIAAPSLLPAGDAPVRKAKVVRVFKSPEGYPNALETVKEGFWIGEQITDRAHLVDFKGKLLKSVNTESSNTSGIAYGGGFLWMGANGWPIRRDRKPTDSGTGAVIKVDPDTGKTVARYPIPGGGGVHGLEYANDTLWITSLKIQKLSQVDPKDFRLIHQIPVSLGRAHGLAWVYDGPGAGSIWCMFSNDRVIHRIDAKDGKVLEVIQLSPEDPDPHGMSLYNGHLYYCDAGIAPGAQDTNSPARGYVCRVDIVS